MAPRGNVKNAGYTRYLAEPARAFGRSAAPCRQRFAASVCVLVTVSAISIAYAKETSIYYSADPLSANIIDADTKAPIDGVHVVAAWEAMGGLEGGSVKSWVMVMETTTDSVGKFAFRGWGPRPRKEGKGLIRDGSPLLILFKSGYELATLRDHTRSPNEYAPLHMSSAWNGQAIELKKSKWPLDTYAERLGFLDVQLDSLLLNDECNWKAIPRFLSAVEQQNRIFIANGTTHRLPSLDYMNRRYSRTCGQLKQYVQEHGK